VTAKAMLKTKRYLWVGFMCHLTVEKSLKAVIATNTIKLPPKIHDLAKLANLAGIYSDFSDTQKSLLATLDPMHIEARYPDYKEEVRKSLPPEVCKNLYLM